MKVMKFVVVAMMLGSLVGTARAEAPVDHYERKPSATLAQAVANFSEYNAKLAALLEKKDLTPQELEAIHEITYTLEVALQKMNSDMARLADTLERLHKASENHDAAGTRKHGASYLATARTVVP
ncbi:MAG TPA: DUF6746 family protein [Azospirillaceae bacterium]|nr:DUF6746 family protein [Azospirillaceae bacterium]